MKEKIKEMERLYDLLSDENREILLKHARQAKREQAKQEQAKQEQAKQKRRRKEADAVETDDET